MPADEPELPISAQDANAEADGSQSPGYSGGIVEPQPVSLIRPPVELSHPAERGDFPRQSAAMFVLGGAHQYRPVLPFVVAENRGPSAQTPRPCQVEDENTSLSQRFEDASKDARQAGPAVVRIEKVVETLSYRS
ncbi:MAG: hypothetical protein H6Q06_2549, partial [Acidobacteria bacterium]|nr:hypothetical protein [Acidobacteriota bacterium]